MSSWGIQKFLNPPDSDDSGFIVGKISTAERNYGFALEAGLTVADCSRRVYLDFDTRAVSAASSNEVARVRKSIKDRRKKVRILRDTINAFCDQMDRALDTVEVELDKAVDAERASR